MSVFYQLVASWWAGWRQAPSAEGLSVLEFFITHFFLGLYYVASHLLRPNFTTGSVDLERHFFDVKNPFFICFLVVFTPSFVIVPIAGSPSGTPVADLISTSAIVTLSILGIASKSRRVHGAIVVLWFAIFVVIEEIQGGL